MTDARDVAVMRQEDELVSSRSQRARGPWFPRSDGEDTKLSRLIHEVIEEQIDDGAFKHGGNVTLQELLAHFETADPERVALLIAPISRDSRRKTAGGNTYMLRWHDAHKVLEVRTPA